ncbi:MAG TPA: phage baseplate assembly protein V [Bryobacteraceae bacterium]|nr:phage baseplate assembly protein V [Bryobacteraceae bacterium]
MSASFLKIGGELVEDALLTLVEVTQKLNHHWWCKVECRQTEDRRMPVENWLGQGLQIVTFQENGAQNVMFDGLVLEVEFEYEIFGSYKFTLTGVTRSYKLDVTPQEAYFRRKNLAEVAQELTADDGLVARVNCRNQITRNYVQWGESDFDFLTRLADDHDAWIRPTSDGIEISDSFQAAAKLEWRTEGSLLSFRVKGALGQSSFQGTHFDPKTMKSSTFRQVRGDPEFYDSSALMVAAVKSASRANLPSGALSMDSRSPTASEYEARLKKESIRAIGSKIVAYGVSQNQDVTAGNQVQVQGLSDAKGTYGVFEVVHRWTQQGYRNEFWCTPWKNFMPREAPRPRTMPGVVFARVVDHNDPRKMGRIKVQYDWQEQSETAWARMIAPHAGSGRGFMFMPEVGDEVLVAFEHGDPERPVVLGSLWNGVQSAPREGFWSGDDVACNDVKRIVTKSGHRIQFVDVPGKECMVLATPGGQSVRLIDNCVETGGRRMVAIESPGDIFLYAEGRVHIRAKYFSREIG